MKLWIAAFLSLILAAGTVAVGPSAVVYFSIRSAWLPGAADLNSAGALLLWVLVGAVVYSVAVTAFLAFGLILDALAAHDTLQFASNSGHCLLRSDWESAFSSEALKPARHRVVAQIAQAEDEALLLATPFSPRSARAEFRAIYFHRLVISQVWSVTCALLLCALLAPLFFESNAALAIVRPILLGTTVVIAMLGVTWMAVSIAVDRLISVLAEAPFLVKSPVAVPLDLRTQRVAEGERLANALAASMRSQVEAVAAKLGDFCSAALDQSLTTRLPEIIAPAISNALEGWSQNARPTIERFLSVVDNHRLEFPARIAEALQSDLQRISTDQIEGYRLASDAVVEEQRVTAAKIDEICRVVTDRHDLQLDVLQRLAASMAELGPELLTALREASNDASEERGRDSRRTTELVQSMQAYAGSLLPAVKRLESYDERLLRAMSYEFETLSQLTVSLNELSGMLEALRVQLGHATVRVSEPLGRFGPTSLQAGEHGLQNGQDNANGLAAELRLLLDDLEEEHQTS